MHSAHSLAASPARMSTPCPAGGAGLAAATDAAVIERSVTVPECFAEIFDRHAECIYRYALAGSAGRRRPT